MKTKFACNQDKEKTMKKIRLLVVDDQTIVREGSQPFWPLIRMLK